MEKKQGNKISITTTDGQPFKVPVEGSLGLLALGYIGIMLWRAKKRELQQQKAGENG